MVVLIEMTKLFQKNIWTHEDIDKLKATTAIKKAPRSPKVMLVKLKDSETEGMKVVVHFY